MHACAGGRPGKCGGRLECPNCTKLAAFAAGSFASGNWTSSECVERNAAGQWHNAERCHCPSSGCAQAGVCGGARSCGPGAMWAGACCWDGGCRLHDLATGSAMAAAPVRVEGRGEPKEQFCSMAHFTYLFCLAWT